ncbi:GyrI-like domain-containing protein [Lentzea tibetensis]|uniref:GyrI-like domain-containing protein n=1 Tax=Lentzea tibetensis TaxID=2591470 RepID=A0A563EIJ9_9PSEU|nr:GyrI-like domain-containing protein [Lentzea tibetensis]TWP46503.1 GyrI-like domain-containing protein [Lentzea tibetensis]
MKIETRPEQPYVAVRGTVTMTTFSKIADRLPELFGLLNARGVPIAGAPFFRYLVIDMEGDIEVEAGIPITEPIEVDGDLFCSTLPAGQYATETHHGHPDGLVAVWDELLSQDLDFDVSGRVWGCRTESYFTHPMVEPDLNNWDTEVAVRLNMP